MRSEDAVIADAFAAALEAVNQPGTMFFGVVRSTNPDGTLTVESGAGERASVRALASYSPRAIGDTVLGVITAMGAVVTGKLGSASTGVATFHLEDAAPVEPGWEEVVSGSIWAKADGSQWFKRLVAAPPPAGDHLQLSSTAVATYRSGGVTGHDRAEQGDYSGHGMQTGLAYGFGSWAPASGGTSTGGTLTVHRRAAGHGFTYGAVNVYAYACLAGGSPPSGPPALLGDPIVFSLSLNQQASRAVPAAFGQMFCDGTANAIAFYSASSRDNAEMDSATLRVDF